MPYVNIRMIEGGATAEQKAELIKGVTDVLVNVLGKSPDTTFIVIDEISAENWGHKGKPVAELKKR